MSGWVERTVGDLVLERPSRSKVFERVGLDYCCKGYEPLAKACRDKGLEIGPIVQELEALDATAGCEEAETWKESLPALVDHLLTTHHAYTKEALPRLMALADKVALVHGPEDARLVELRDAFEIFVQETFDHLAKEEGILFPMCLAIAEGQGGGHCGSIAMPIGRMEYEHVKHGANLELFRELTDGYAPPEHACNTYRALLDGLHELEQDLHRHIHKENHLLFPWVQDLEKII